MHDRIECRGVKRQPTRRRKDGSGAGRKVVMLCGLKANGEAFVGQITQDDLTSMTLGQIQAGPAPAGSDVEEL
jgi:hypothetical protein